MNPFVEVQHLTKSIGSLVLFEDISFSIMEGAHIGLIARNGKGKTTLLNILSGKDDYDSGEIVFRRDLKVGYLEQSPFFDPELSVMEVCLSSVGDFSNLIMRYEKCLLTPGNPGLAELID